MTLSVLMPIYIKENPVYLHESLHSLFKQTLPFDELVLIEDGPITSALQDVLSYWEKKLPLRRIALPQNQGLGLALNAGVLACRNEWIARMDADDLAHPERFAKQVHYLKNHPEIAVVGSWIREFSESPEQTLGVRKLPTKPEKIRKFAKKRSPLNHMTVVFRRSAVLSSGNYQSFLGFEDYALWVRMLLAGFQFANLPECLVDARAGESLITRRGGLFYAQREFLFQRDLWQKGFISFPLFCQNILLRVLVRFLPKALLSRTYRSFLRSS